ncbi:DNA ligase [bacterium]|nr:DNA ligase [Chloroflexi bacterium CFX6]RIL11107.1 MAG: DNA ligase [bacterium]
MTTFFRFPRTPHLAWLGVGSPRDDKLLSPSEARALLEHVVVVEEKVDGANVGLSLDEDGEVQAQNRGAYLTRESAHPQFRSFFRWLEPHRRSLADVLGPDLMVFGEWCYAVHSVRYSRLPDWFLAFDVYDRRERAFWSVPRRDALIARLGFASVPVLGRGRFDLQGLTRLLAPTRLGDGLAEGLYVRADAGDRLAARAKLVHPSFVQAMDEIHWSHRPIEPNRLVHGHTGVVPAAR